jgi:cytochrome oxidase Cu insertion factor (SCO1/SenC/PrrC family)
MRWARLLLGGMGLACLGGGLIFYQLHKAPVAVVSQGGRGNPLIKADFSLVDQEGQSFSAKEVRGKYVLVYFGYRFCPDVCPLGLSNLSQAIEQLGRDRQEVVPIFITVDPERDQPKELKAYATHFHPHFKMLTGSVEAIEKAKAAFKVYAAKVKDTHSTADYLVDHTSFIYLMGRDGRFIQHFPHTEPPEKIAQAVQQCLNQEKKSL